MSVPYDEIEAGIRPIVRVLNEAGIDTFASCEGHGGDTRPWVNCGISDDYGVEDIVSVLVDNWIGGFSVSEVWFIRNNTTPFNKYHKNKHYHHWSIWFWKQSDNNE